MKKDGKKIVIDNSKNNEKQKAKLGFVSLYENPPIENQLSSEFEKFIFQNQLSDLKKIENQKNFDLIDYGNEKIFFDLFMKNKKINKKVLKKDIEKQVISLSKKFINEFDLIDNKNISIKNYEKLLIEKINNKFILDYIKKNGNKIDKKDFYIIQNLLKKLENLKNQYKLIGFDKLKYYENLLTISKNNGLKIGKNQKKAIKKDINFSIDLYKKDYQKFIQKKLKCSNRLQKKYGFLIDNELTINCQ